MPSARFDFDRIARAVLSGRRGLGHDEDRLADLAATLMRGKLEAAGAPGGSVLRPAPSAAARVHFERRIPPRLLERIEKLIGSRILREERGGRPLPV